MKLKKSPTLYTSFQTRFLALVTGLIVTLLLSVTVIYTNNIRNSLLAEFYLSGQINVEKLSAQSYEGVVTLEKGLIRMAVNAVIHERDAKYAFVYDYEGNLLYKQELVPVGKQSIDVFQISGLTKRIMYIGEDSSIRALDFVLPIDDMFTGEQVGFARLGFTLERLREEIREIIVDSVYIFFFFFLAGLGVSYWVSKRLSRPINEISSKMNEIIIKSNLDERIELETNIREIDILKTNFNIMLFEIDQHRKMLVEKERVEKELEIAKLIQTALLPDISKVSTALYEIDALMVPAEEVGGDYFDLIQAADGRIWYGIGDVTGHGIIPGMIMMMAQTIANTLISEIQGLTPKELIIRLNRILTRNIRERLKVNHYMTLAFLVSDREGHFRFAGSHLDMLIYRQENGSCDVVKTDGLWVGIRPDITDSTIENNFDLNKGDVLILYSDGVIEAMNTNMEQFGVKRLEELVVKYTKQGGGSLISRMVKDVQTFLDVQRDDITIFAVRYHGQIRPLERIN